MNYFLNSLKLIAVILLSAILIFAAALNIIFLGNKETANFFGKTLFMYGDYESKPDIENNCLYVAEKSDRAKMGVGNDIIYEDAYGEKYIGKIVGVDTTELETAYIMSDNERVAYSSVLYYCTSRSTSFYSIVKFTISISGIVGLIVLPILLITFFIVLGIAYKRNELIDEYDISESKDSSALSKPKKSASRPITLVSEPEPEKLSDEDDEVKTYRPKPNAAEFSDDIFAEDTKSKILEAMNKVKESNLNEDYIVFQTKPISIPDDNGVVDIEKMNSDKKGANKTSIEQVLFEKPGTSSKDKALFDISKKAAQRKTPADPLSTAQIVLENTTKPVPEFFGKSKPQANSFGKAKPQSVATQDVKPQSDSSVKAKLQTDSFSTSKPQAAETQDVKPSEDKYSAYKPTETQKQSDIQKKLQAEKDRIAEISTDELFDDIMKLLDK